MLSYDLMSPHRLSRFFSRRTQINFTVAIDFTASNGKCSVALVLLIMCMKRFNVVAF